MEILNQLWHISILIYENHTNKKKIEGKKIREGKMLVFGGCYIGKKGPVNWLLNFSSASIFKVLWCWSKFMKMLFWVSNCLNLDETQSYSASMRRRVTLRLIQIRSVCIWHSSCDWQAMSQSYKKNIYFMHTWQKECNDDGHKKDYFKLIRLTANIEKRYQACQRFAKYTLSRTFWI